MNKNFIEKNTGFTPLEIARPKSPSGAQARARSLTGFTLIEALLYIALFAIVIGGGMVATYQIIQATDASINQTILQEEANFLLRKVNWALTGATAITVNPSTLQTTKLISDVSTQLTFALTGTNITLRRGSNSPVILNSSSIQAKNLLFSNISGSPHGVATSFTLTTAQNGRAATQNFKTTKYLRY